MFSADFEKRRVEAFRAAGEAASPKNDVSGCEVEDAYVEIQRRVEMRVKNPAAAKAATMIRLKAIADERELEYDAGREEFCSGEAGEGGENSLWVRIEGRKVSVGMMFRKYFGAECRDNTPEDFASWAKGYSEHFDEVEKAVKAAVEFVE